MEFIEKEKLIKNIRKGNETKVFNILNKYNNNNININTTDNVK